MQWQPQLSSRNQFGRDALLERDFDPLNDIPAGADRLLLDDDWGVWILQQPDGERIRHSVDLKSWQAALSHLSRDELAILPFSTAIQTLGSDEIIELYHYFKQHHLLALDHLAAIRAILAPDGTWIWCIGICHDAILARSGFDRLLARYRNQRTFQPRIEFEPDADIVKSLQPLLEQGVDMDDFLDIEGEAFRATSVGDALGRLSPY